MNKKNYYNNLNFLRAFACICIIIMHIKANTKFRISGYLFNTIVPSLTWLVYLFMMLSGFSMCCGYYDKIKNGNININDFYKKRFQKILPFYSLLVIFSVVEEGQFSSILEGFANLTMSFGLMPNNNPSVIGVGWTLQLIFLFYMLFPYFVFLIYNKRRAWLSLLASLMINYACGIYFFSSKFVINTFTPRHAFIYTVPFFIVGGLIYLYRDNIKSVISKHAILAVILTVLITISWYCTPNSILGFSLFDIKCILLFVSWISLAIGIKTSLLDNKCTNYLGNISMEMYLSHMLIFRIIEKLGWVYIYGRNSKSFLTVCIIEMILLILFVQITKNTIDFLIKKIIKMKG